MQTQTSKHKEANTDIAQDNLNILAPSSPGNSAYTSEVKQPQLYTQHLHSFLMHIYNSLHRRTNKKVDMFALSDLSGYPLLYCEKATNYITNGKHSIMTSEEFITLLTIMYFESILNKTKFAASLFDFKKKEFILLSDVKVLLLHFHMRIFNDSSEKQVIEIIEKFYGHKIQMSKDAFIKHSLDKNFDIIHLLFTYLEKYKPFDYEQYLYFQDIYQKTTFQSNFNPDNSHQNSAYSNHSNINSVNTITPSNPSNPKLLDLGGNYFQMQSLHISPIKETAICYSPPHFKNPININHSFNFTTIPRATTSTSPSKPFTKTDLFSSEHYSSLTFHSISKLVSHKAKLYAKTVLAMPMRSNELNDKEDNEMKTIMEVFDEHYKNTTKILKRLNESGQCLMSSCGKEGRRERARSAKGRCLKKEEDVYRNRDWEYEKVIYRFFKRKEREGREMKMRLYYYDDFYLNHNKTLTMATNSYMKINTYGWISYANSNNGGMVPSAGNSIYNGCSTNCESVFNNTEDVSIYVNNNNANIVNPLSKKEIFVYKLNRHHTKFKCVKLIVISNMIFYHTKNNQSKFQFKRIIMITQLYPKLHRTCFFPPNISIPNSLLTSSSKIYQLQLISSLHNHITSFDLYFTSKDSLELFVNHLVIYQNIRNLEKSFTFGEELGAGRFGKVITGKHKVTKESYAIKSVDKMDDSQNEENYKCYMWEKDIFVFLKGVNDSHLEKCFDYYETPEHIFYIKEVISGGDLKSLINKNFFNDICEDRISMINNLTKQMLKGLQRLHHYGIIHRDIKHTNMLVNILNENEVILKIIDFGLSKVMGYNEYAIDHYGSLSFKSPELVAGSKYSFNVDIWAIGITVYFLMYGTYPIKADNKQNLKKMIANFQFDPAVHLHKGNVKEYMNKVIISALVRDPHKRANINQMMKIENDDELLY